MVRDDGKVYFEIEKALPHKGMRTEAEMGWSDFWMLIKVCRTMSELRREFMSLSAALEDKGDRDQMGRYRKMSVGGEG